MLKAPWDVWIADVKFEDNPLKSKRRPVIILESDSVITLSIKGTTHMPRSGYPGEYTLIDWKEAGLDRETVVRCSQPIYLEESDFKKPIGKLRIIDIINIKEILRNISYTNRNLKQ